MKTIEARLDALEAAMPAPIDPDAETVQETRDRLLQSVIDSVANRGDPEPGPTKTPEQLRDAIQEKRAEIEALEDDRHMPPMRRGLLLSIKKRWLAQLIAELEAKGEIT